MTPSPALKPPPLVYRPPHAPYLPIAYVDDHVIVVDKPQGLLSVPGKGLPDCVEARAQAIFPEALITHRIDMDTGGLLLMARSKRAQRILSGQFEKRIIEKTYLAEVWAAPEDDEGQITLPLRADWPNRPRQMVCHEAGKAAETRWTVLRRGTTSLLRLHPRTGRSHQLRVHMAAIGHPIIGDPIYADGAARAAAPQLQLFATEIGWRCPGDGAWRAVARSGP
ncbi:MAG: RluA family pseudouridine synthase [Pseudomonadota bacterium]